MFEKFRRNKYADLLSSLYLLLIVSLCICSCTSENNIFDNSKLLNFSVFVPEWKNNDSSSNLKTRAMPVSGSSFDKASSFNIIADVYDGKSSYNTVIKDETVSYTNNMWQTTASHYWPGNANNTVNFYAYYPTGISSGITHTAGSAPILSYTVPNDAASQIDIMTATANNVIGNTNSSTPLTFNHIFAAVKFSVGTSGLPSGTVKTITISGINNSGTYTFGSGWTLGPSTSVFTVSPSTVITGVAGANITSDAFTMMMIPQAYNNATITLVYSNGTTFSTTISGGTWNAGGSYTYNLSKTIIYNYDYTGSVQTFTAPYTGTYKIECWGAGSANCGGYVKGYLKITVNTILYIYVGQQGPNYGKSLSFNGGGLSTLGPNGSGATDIRLNSGDWNNFESLKSRVIVAGGGSGFGAGGGQAGGLIGYASTHPSYPQCCGKGGGQTYGGTVPTFWSEGKSNGTAGSFGIGGNGGLSGDNISSGGGGGGGYYGGSGGSGASSGTFGGGGGSSFISGYTGCNAILSSSSSTAITHTDSPNHYSGYVFTNSTMIAGNALMPAPSGGTETGHTGNGYARIAFVSAD